MKAYVTTIGEKTTDICCEQLKKFGFDVLVLRGDEPWLDKYKKFIISALQNVGDEGCLRIDADVVPNKEIKEVGMEAPNDALISVYTLYDLYRNGLFLGSPIFYKKEAIEIIKKNLDKLNPLRPEASACRLPEINDKKFFSEVVVGMHGFFQDDIVIMRARQNKEARGQIDKFDFELVEKLVKL